MLERHPALECTVMKDVIVVHHPEFDNLQHQIGIATNRFNQATKEKQESLALIGTLHTITSEDREEFLEQIETEQEAYDVIQELHDKIIRLLSENHPGEGRDDGPALRDQGG
jgi:hypothetical protein